MQTTRRPKAWTPRGFPPNARHAEITEVLRSETVEACRDSRRARREAVFVGAMLCAIVAASVGGSWFYSIRTARENFEARLTGFASAAALQVDPALHGLIRHPSQVDGPEYRRAVAPLRRMRAAIPEIRFLYTIVRDGEDVRIILDAADPGDLDRDGIEDRPNVWELSVSPQLAKQYALGWRGPWGTTYPPNLRLSIPAMTEDEWVKKAATLTTRPPRSSLNLLIASRASSSRPAYHPPRSSAGSPLARNRSMSFQCR